MTNSPDGSENASGRTTPICVEDTNIQTDNNSEDGRTVAAQLFPKALALSVDSLDRGQAKKTKKQFTQTIRERKLATGKPIWVLLLQEQDLVFVGTIDECINLVGCFISQDAATVMQQKTCTHSKGAIADYDQDPPIIRAVCNRGDLFLQNQCRLVF